MKTEEIIETECCGCFMLRNTQCFKFSGICKITKKAVKQRIYRGSPDNYKYLKCSADEDFQKLKRSLFLE